MQREAQNWRSQKDNFQKALHIPNCRQTCILGRSAQTNDSDIPIYKSDIESFGRHHAQFMFNVITIPVALREEH
jgi:hypothetical protein